MALFSPAQILAVGEKFGRKRSLQELGHLTLMSTPLSLHCGGYGGWEVTAS